MNIYIVILVVVVIIAILSLITFISLNKLKGYKEKMDIAEKNIDSCLDKKLELIISINGDIKKIITEKDYLKDYVGIKDLIMTNIEKDIKLNEAYSLINKLIVDNDKLSKNDKVNKKMAELRKNDEKLVSSKNLFNKAALVSNNTIKTFPNNIVSKLFNYKIRSYYNNKAEDVDNF